MKKKTGPGGSTPRAQRDLTCEGAFRASARRCRFLPDGRWLSVRPFGCGSTTPRSGELLQGFHGDLTIQTATRSRGLIAAGGSCSTLDVNLLLTRAPELSACLSCRARRSAWCCRARRTVGCCWPLRQVPVLLRRRAVRRGVVWGHATARVVRTSIAFRVMVSAVAFRRMARATSPRFWTLARALDTRNGRTLASVDPPRDGPLAAALAHGRVWQCLAGGRVRSWDAAHGSRARRRRARALLSRIAPDGSYRDRVEATHAERVRICVLGSATTTSPPGLR